MSMRDKAQRNRPTVAGVATGLVVAAGQWGVEALPASIPGGVTGQLELAVIVVAGIVGGAAGKWAQRQTWAKDTHLAAAAYALSLDPSDEDSREMIDEFLERVGIGTLEDAERLIGQRA